jgi:4-carboxymuconolactone decarboxylase
MPQAGEVSPVSVDARARGRREGPVMAVVAAETYATLSGISAGDLKLLDSEMGLREPELAVTGLDARTSALAKIAALIALDAPPASYAWLVANAVDEGATPEDILGVLRAVAPQVGGARVVAGALEIMVALGLARAG